MAIDIFSGFDPIWFNLCLSTSISLFLPIVLLFSVFWFINFLQIRIISPISLIIKQIYSTKTLIIKSYSILICSIFLFIIYLNLIGIIPYLFSISRHIIFTISIGLPLWLSLIISTFTNSPKKSLAHFLPDGAPSWLSPFLVIIEFIRVCVRPLTLSFRLAANITAGHIVLILICSFSISLSFKPFIYSTLIAVFYILFELVICLIQAYIFSLLVTLYRNEHI